MLNSLAVGIGGFVGSVLLYWIRQQLAKCFG